MIIEIKKELVTPMQNMGITTQKVSENLYRGEIPKKNVSYQFCYRGLVPEGTVFSVKKNGLTLMDYESVTETNHFIHAFKLTDLKIEDEISIELYNPLSENVFYSEVYIVAQKRGALILPVLMAACLTATVVGALMWDNNKSKALKNSTLTPTPVAENQNEDPVSDYNPPAPVDGSGTLNPIPEYDPQAVKDALNAMQNSCEINAAGYIKFDTVDSYGELMLRNANNFYVQVSILPYENGAVAGLDSAYFTSIMIPPGGEMNEIKLDKNLDKLKVGSQSVLLYYNCYKLVEEKYTYLGACALKITLELGK